MKAIVATVISTKMQKTAVVAVASSWRHPLYQKIVRRSRKFLVHNDIGAKVGDKVVIQEVRPISKNKHRKIIEIIKPNL